MLSWLHGELTSTDVNTGSDRGTVSAAPAVASKQKIRNVCIWSSICLLQFGLWNEESLKMVRKWSVKVAR